MIVFGIIFLVLGAAGCVYGITQNNSLEAQLESILGNGRTNPGTVFIVIGVVIAVIGIILLFKGITKKS